ncbi:MAG: M14 family zinc carboxypeptidase, partial [Ignavibacteria bacterium]|nr:M14 family zinc carboxypeptidase [Ignavibacteria bacterium]
MKTIFLLLFIEFAFAQVQTPLEKNNYLKVTTYDELTNFVYQVDESSDLLSVEVIGKSVEGRNLYAIRFSNSEFGKDESKIKVLIFAQQHGNEQSGKEGALLLII